MKKTYLFQTNFKIIIAALALFAFSQAEAQVTFKPGLRAGANFSHFSRGDESYYYASEGYYDINGNFVPTYTDDAYNSKTGFYVGFYGALRLTRFYTLQPEITFSNQGSTYKGFSYVPVTGLQVPITRNLDVSYLSVAVVNKFTFNDKFNIHVGPTIDFIVDQNFDTDSDVDLAFILGAGFNITRNLGIEARVKKGIVPVLDFSSSNHTNVVFSVGATYTFDVK
jgi:hypothetical protein